MHYFIKKRLVPLVLSCVLMLGAVPTSSAASGFDNFEKSKVYSEGQFTDVKSDAWYHPYVKQAYELGLMTGNSLTTFNPNGNITFAEAITMASRINMIYKGENPKLEPDAPWFMPYVRYAAANGIINSVDEYQNYTWEATRAQLAVIFSNALPDECYKQINDITLIPDVPSNLPFADEILKMYNAGIISGVDSKGTFNPYKAITRAEVSTIAANIVLPELRKEFQLSSEILNTDTEDVVEEDVAKKEEQKLSVSQTNLTISKETTVMVTATGDDVTVIWSCDSDIVEVQWGDWNGDDIPLIITPKKNGTAIIKVYTEKEPDKYESVSVTVNGYQTETVPVVSYAESAYYQLAKDACKYIRQQLAYPHSLDLISAEAGVLDGEMAVHFSYFALNSKGVREWEIKYYTYTPSGRISAWTPWLIDSDFIPTFRMNVNRILD